MDKLEQVKESTIIFNKGNSVNVSNMQTGRAKAVVIVQSPGTILQEGNWEQDRPHTLQGTVQNENEGSPVTND